MSGGHHTWFGAQLQSDDARVGSAKDRSVRARSSSSQCLIALARHSIGVANIAEGMIGMAFRSSILLLLWRDLSIEHCHELHIK
jgi:hypothetical protein